MVEGQDEIGWGYTAAAALLVLLGGVVEGQDGVDIAQLAAQLAQVQHQGEVELEVEGVFAAPHGQQEGDLASDSPGVHHVLQMCCVCMEQSVAVLPSLWEVVSLVRVHHSRHAPTQMLKHFCQNGAE